MTISLTTSQQNETTALGCVAWALLDAEARDDRRGAGSLVPIWASSWNVWSDGVRANFPAAPRTLDVTAAWSSNHFSALVFTLVTLLQLAWGSDGVDLAAARDAVSPMPGGPVPNAFRGVWFETQFRDTYTGPVLDGACSAMQHGGAAQLSVYTDGIARGASSSAVTPTIPRSSHNVPTVPAQTTVPAPFAIPLSIGTGEDGAMVIDGAAPGARAPFPIVPVLVGGGLLAAAAGVAAYGAKHWGWFR